MEKEITINPHTKDMSVLATAVKLKNDFLVLGFKTPVSFIEIVQEYLPEYKEYHKAKKLHNWWFQRSKSEELNKKIDLVINKLKTE